MGGGGGGGGAAAPCTIMIDSSQPSFSYSYVKKVLQNKYQNIIKYHLCAISYCKASEGLLFCVRYFSTL